MFRTLVALVFLVGVVLGQYPNVIELCKLVSGRIGSHFIRDPRNCSCMYNCDGDKSFPILMNCNSDLVFSQSYQACVYRNSDFDDCKMNVYQGRYNDPLCNPKPEGLNRDPMNCNRFIPCWKGNSFPSMKCQTGLEFSFEKQQCVEPGKAKCLRRPG